MRRIDLRTRDDGSRVLPDRRPELRRLLPRASFDVDAAVDVVRPICDDVASRGRTALAQYAQTFDGVVPEVFRVPQAMLTQALDNLDPDLRESFETAIERRRSVCRREAGEPEVTVEPAEDAQVTRRLVPIERVGLYVPGGLAPLASTVIMNAVPAQVAGVSSLALASPPQRDHGGLPHPNVLAVCALLGIEEVYAVGGAQAVAMFGYGVDGLCEPVDMITGPGNIYVVAAKRLLRGTVEIDAEAGPTEIAIVADETADADFVAADLISQAEHDPAAASVLITDSAPFADAVDDAVETQLAETKHQERIAAALSGEQSGTVMVDDMSVALTVADAYAAEHLEIQTRHAAELAGRIRNAGAIFVGGWSPVSLGDYAAGSTHVLPTGGGARHTSGLTVRSYLKAVQVITYGRAGLAAVAEPVERFAESEDLPAHGAAIAIRRTGGGDRA